MVLFFVFALFSFSYYRQAPPPSIGVIDATPEAEHLVIITTLYLHTPLLFSFLSLFCAMFSVEIQEFENDLMTGS